MDRNKQAFFEYILRIGDDLLVLGHRLSEWSGHGPILEEDIALSNIALDCIGQAQALLKLAGEIEGKGRTEDDLAYFRTEREFRNLQLVEQPNGDFAKTIIRQFLFDAYALHLFEALSKNSNETLAGIAAKALKETRYHLRHTSEWVLRMGDGTEESHNRAQAAINELWAFTSEIFDEDEVQVSLEGAGLVPSLQSIKPKWEALVAETFKRATLTLPIDSGYHSSRSREGIHTEHLGHMLAEMQSLARAHPGAKW